MAQARSIHQVTKSTRAETLDIGADLEALLADSAGQERQTDPESAEAEDYLTVRQMMEYTKHSSRWIYDRLKQLKCENRLAVRSIRDIGITGRTFWKSVYRILPRKGRRREKIIDSVGSSGGLNALREGRKGTIPYGFELDPDGIYQLRENPNEQAVIRRMMGWRNRGWTYEKIATTLVTQGVPAKHGPYWHNSIIRGILMRFSVEQSKKKAAGKPGLKPQSVISRKAKEGGR